MNNSVNPEYWAFLNKICIFVLNFLQVWIFKIKRTQNSLFIQ